MLEGKKVILDVIDPKNIEWMRQQRNKPEMRQYFRAWKEISKDQQQKWYSAIGNNTADNHVYFEIHEKPNDQNSVQTKGWTDYPQPSAGLVGCCGLHYIDWRLRAAEFGIFLAAEARGKGLGKDALITLFDYGFREMNLHKIWAEVYDNNQAIHVYTGGLGMTQDGLLRDNYFCNGKYGNSIMLSVLEDEWFEMHGGR